MFWIDSPLADKILCHVEFTEHFYTMADEECMSVILEGEEGMWFNFFILLNNHNNLKIKVFSQSQCQN